MISHEIISRREIFHGITSIQWDNPVCFTSVACWRLDRALLCFELSGPVRLCGTQHTQASQVWNDEDEEVQVHT